MEKRINDLLAKETFTGGWCFIVSGIVDINVTLEKAAAPLGCKGALKVECWNAAYGTHMISRGNRKVYSEHQITAKKVEAALVAALNA